MKPHVRDTLYIISHYQRVESLVIEHHIVSAAPNLPHERLSHQIHNRVIKRRALAVSKKVFEAVTVFDQRHCPPITQTPDLDRFIAIHKKMIRSFYVCLTKGVDVIRKRDTSTNKINFTWQPVQPSSPNEDTNFYQDCFVP